MSKPYILVLHAGHVGGKIETMSRMIAEGVNNFQAMDVRVRTVPMLDADVNKPQAGDIIATIDDIEHAQGIILGSPTRFGNMAASLKYFIDQLSSIWMRRVLEGKPCGFFTSSSSMHGGQESTLLSMMIPMMHFGMVIVGVPYSEEALGRTKTGGTPYGASHVNGGDFAHPLSIDEDEYAICVALGRRVADIAWRLMIKNAV